jgi:hypothetical protein
MYPILAEKVKMATGRIREQYICLFKADMLPSPFF